MKLSKVFNEFFESEKSGGLILVLVATVSLCLANSTFQQQYISFWSLEVGSHTLVGWINDGFMTLFFLLIGLELEREVYAGELSSLRNAALPIFGALGGMFVPAAIFFLFNVGKPTQSGAGIPMATDIAFAVGVLSLLGRNVPAALKVFLMALAVIDDLGAVMVIAIFYTKTIIVSDLAIVTGIWALLFTLNRLKIYNLVPYLIGGIVMWYFMLHSGIHATVTGVILAFVIPFGNGSEKSPSYILQRALHYPVAFVILPLFAIANTCISIPSGWHQNLTGSSSIGIIAGLIIGKPLGIWMFTFAAAALGFCALPSGIRWKHIAGVGFLGGIGFTMSIFITLLAFEDKNVHDHSKIAIIIASVIAGTIGFLLLKSTLDKTANGALPTQTVI